MATQQPLTSMSGGSSYKSRRGLGNFSFQLSMVVDNVDVRQGFLPQFCMHSKVASQDDDLFVNFT